MIVFFVTERLAFGSKCTRARHVERLRALGITHVIDLRHYHVKKLRTFKTLWLTFKDNARPRPRWFYRDAFAFYRKAMIQPGTKVFVMCRAGRRRSASMTYFLLRASGVGPRKAETTIRRARPCVQIVREYRESGEEYLRRMKRWLNLWGNKTEGNSINHAMNHQLTGSVSRRRSNLRKPSAQKVELPFEQRCKFVAGRGEIDLSPACQCDFAQIVKEGQ